MPFVHSQEQNTLKIALQNHSKAVTDENREFTIRKPFPRADRGEPTLTFTIGNAAGRDNKSSG